MATDKQLNLSILNSAIDRETRNIARQDAALEKTLKEINLIENFEKTTPGAFGLALIKLRTKRERQIANLKGTTQQLEALRATIS